MSTNVSIEAWRRAFYLMCELELECSPKWQGPENVGELQQRVTLLAELLDLVPRPFIANLPDVVLFLSESFPEGTPISRKEVRDAIRRILTIEAADYVKGPFERAALALPQKSQPASGHTRLRNTVKNDDVDYDLCYFGVGTWLTRLEKEKPGDTASLLTACRHVRQKSWVKLAKYEVLTWRDE